MLKSIAKKRRSTMISLRNIALLTIALVLILPVSFDLKDWGSELKADVVNIANARADAASDEEIVAMIGAGKVSAETTLVQRFSRGLMIMLVGQTRDRELAQDLHQETFKAVLRSARNGKIRKPASLKSFIHQTAINTLIGHKRKEARGVVEHQDERIMRVADSSAGPLGRLETEQTLQRVQQAMSELTVERDRQLLSRYFVEQVSKSRLCEDLGLSADHFDRVLYRARQRLMQLLELG